MLEKCKQLDKENKQLKKELKTIKSNIDYFVGFCGHNKNLTKEQYFKLEEIKEILKAV